MATEYRYAALESNGRTLAGTAITYGEVAQIPDVGRERFMPNSLSMNPDGVILNRMHDRRVSLARNTQGGGLTLQDSAEALRVSAKLPPTRDADDTLELVKRKILQGFSLEFSVQKETRTADNIREISQATLHGLGVVDRPAYAGSEVQARRRGGMSATIPFRKRMRCKCHPGKANSISIDDIELPDDTDVLAIAGDYSRSIASLRKGSLELKKPRLGCKSKSVRRHWKPQREKSWQLWPQLCRSTVGQFSMRIILLTRNSQRRATLPHIQSCASKQF